MLNLGVYSPSKTSEEWLLRFYKVSAEAFTEGHLIAFAERGISFFRDRLIERATAGNVRSAAYFAYRDDDRGVETLRHAVETAKSPLDVVLAGAALRKIGDVDAWQRSKDSIRKLVGQYLEQDDLASAKRVTLEAEHLFNAFREANPRGYAVGGWWGFDRTSPMWLFKAHASDHIGAELDFYLRMNDKWEPNSRDIQQRIEKILSR